MYIQWNNEQTKPYHVGMKSYNLGELERIGVKIPPGFTLTRRAFWDFITANGIYNKIKALVTDIPSNVHAIKDRSQRLYDLFTDTEIPPKIINEITEACNNLTSLFKKKIQFTVRSSSVIEDLESASFAGLYDTFLSVESYDEVLKSVKRCWQSAFSFRALTYLKKLELKIKDPKYIAMGVIIQQMIDQRFAGVMFTVNPANGDPSEILIEYSSRLEGVVASGRCTPSSLLINKITNRIVSFFGY